MEKRLVLKLNNHNVYYVKTDVLSYYITIPKNNDKTSISIELKSKMDNYNLDTNDELWVMENVKSTFSYVDEYNITLVLPVLDDKSVSILEKVDSADYEIIDKLLGHVINNAYANLKEEKKEIDSKIILISNERYKSFIVWFVSRYKERVMCKNLLEVIQMYNVNATAYKKFETPAISFVVGSYASEVNAPKSIPEDDELQVKKYVPQVSSGFTSYWFLVIVTIVVALAIAILAFAL